VLFSENPAGEMTCSVSFKDVRVHCNLDWSNNFNGFSSSQQKQRIVIQEQGNHDKGNRSASSAANHVASNLQQLLLMRYDNAMKKAQSEPNE